MVSNQILHCDFEGRLVYFRLTPVFVILIDVLKWIKEINRLVSRRISNIYLTSSYGSIADVLKLWSLNFKKSSLSQFDVLEF